AAASLQIGDIYATLSRYDEALSSFQEASALAGDDPEVHCQALSRMARIYANRGRSEADSSSEQEFSLSEGLSKKTAAEALQARGETLLYSHPQTARNLLDRARALFKEANEPNGEAEALLMLAYVESRKDRTEAVRLAAESLGLARSQKN